jgi:peptide/nickel transport system substrate-binding protein
MLNIKSLYKTKTNYLANTFKAFTLTEKTLVVVFLLIAIISGLSLLGRLNDHLTTAVPAHGGSLNEGLVGSPRFINPLLELSDADRDLTYLIYSGLMRATSEGKLISDLAESYKISDDGLTYTFKIRDDARFHDGVKVTADDIEYTIEMAQNVTLRSPKRTNWTGVTVKKISPSEISFELKQPYSPFLENTTLGILPKHIWSSATPDDMAFSPFNISAVGSGPYRILNIDKNGSGIPTSYELKAYQNYILGEPYITNIRLNFYPNEKDLVSAYLAGEIESTSALSPQSLESLKKLDSINEKRISLPRVFGVFFNQNQNKVLLNKEVRQALNMTVDRDRIVNEVLGGYGESIDSPLPDGILSSIRSATTTALYNRAEAIKSAQAVLTKAGWKFSETKKIWEKVISKKETQTLAFTISTANTEDLKKTAEVLREDWSLLGVKVDVQTFDQNDLNQTVIGQRKYDALLFGQVVGRSLDLFAFWHSSQRVLGYNVAMYANIKADNLLEEARQTTDLTKRLKDYAAFETEIKNDIPAIFIYSPQFIYTLPQKIQGFSSGLINNRSERFEQIYKWYVETDKVWNFLAQ